MLSLQELSESLCKNSIRVKTFNFISEIKPEEIDSTGNPADIIKVMSLLTSLEKLGFGGSEQADRVALPRLASFEVLLDNLGRDAGPKTKIAAFIEDIKNCVGYSVKTRSSKVNLYAIETYLSSCKQITTNFVDFV